MKRFMIAVVLTTILAAPVLATREPTLPPVYYLIDYGQGHLDNPDYVEWIAELPPQLLHFGKDVPMTHIYGPIQAVGGENQAHGRNREDIRRLTPAEVRERIETLQRMNEALRGAGVEMVMPYTSSITFAGHPETREGLFDFYDHWEEYAEFGLGPKPASPPNEWPAIKADGSLHTFGKELQPEYYAGLYRYVAAITHPDWRDWLVDVHRLVAAAGYDGAFPDNTSPINDYSIHAQEAFRDYLSEKFSAAEISELFGVRDVAEVTLPAENEGVAWVEAQRFWRVSLGQHANAMRAGGRQVNPDFRLFPNLGGPTHVAEYMVGNADFYMAEGGRGFEGAGCGVQRVIGDIAYREAHDNIIEYVYGRDLPSDLGTMLLKLGRGADSRKLVLAEAAAFGTASYNGVRPSSREVQAPYIRFLLENADAYDRKISAARVAMLFFPMRDFYRTANSVSRHTQTARRIFERLNELQAPCDLFSETGLEADVLATYDVLIAPEMEYLSDDHLAVMRGFVESGGTLIAVGEFATHDEVMRERGGIQWLPAPDETQRVGAGTIIRRELLPTQTEILELLAPVGETRVVVDETKDVHPLLRSSCYADDSEVVVHLLNYSIPIEVGAGETVPRENVRVRAPLPEGAQVARVECIAPEMESFAPQFGVRDGACWFTVPEVPIYVVARVVLE
ncbi:MAG: hypothetical protein GX131_08685 [candidate division WS1 bacterium]|jgi:hypothetical protein|nr:hypothetical protein [candidate division WS1 bacterium]